MDHWGGWGEYKMSECECDVRKAQGSQPSNLAGKTSRKQKRANYAKCH